MIETRAGFLRLHSPYKDGKFTSEFDYKAPPNQVTQQEVIEAMAACVRKAAMLLVVYHPRHVKSSATPLDKLPPAELD